MKKYLQQLKKEVEAVRLAPEEKLGVRENIVAFMAFHPVREEAGTRHIGQKRASFRSFSLLLTKRYMMATLAVILTLALGGGVTYAAEGSIPGDALYPVKIKVNEEVRAAVAVSTEAEAKWSARRAERRLEEAAVLAATGKLDTSARVELENKFEEQANKMRARAKMLEDSGKAEDAAVISARLEATLLVHERLLEEIAAGKNDRIDTELRSLISKIRLQGDVATETRIEVEKKVEAEAKAAAEARARGRMTAAENKLEEAARFITSAKLTSATRSDADVMLSLSKEALTEGKTQFSSKAFAEAFVTFGKAHRLAEEAKTQAQTQQLLEVRVPGIRLDVRDRAEIDEDRRLEEIRLKTEKENKVNEENEKRKKELELKNEAKIKNETDALTKIRIENERKVKEEEEKKKREMEEKREQELKNETRLDGEARVDVRDETSASVRERSELRGLLDL